MDKENIPEEQREFLFFLLGSTPSLEVVQRIVHYETRLDQINRKNWFRRVIKEQGRTTLETMARLDKVPFKEYVESIAKEQKEIEIKALNEVFEVETNKDKKPSEKDKIDKHFEKNKQILEEAKKESILTLSREEIINKLKEKSNG